MAQLYFRYGAMNSGKSIEILKVAHNYEEQDKTVLLFTPSIDTRDGDRLVSSRIGVSRPAISVSEYFDFESYIHETGADFIDCILVDEAQFLTKSQVYQLARVVDLLDIPVMAFGLKNDFRNELFEGTAVLLSIADKIEEIKTICWHCHKKATMNLRLIDGSPVYSGEQIQIGGNETYRSVCRKHYFQYPKITPITEIP